MPSHTSLAANIRQKPKKPATLLAFSLYREVRVMENLDEGSKAPCAERCPYLLGAPQQQPVTTEVLGVLCVSSPVVDAKLRAYQTRNCAGIEVEGGESGAVFCDFRQQMYDEDGTPGTRIIDEARRIEQLRTLHSGLWQEKLAGATTSYQNIVRRSVNAIQSQKYTPEEIAFARIGLRNGEYNRSPSGLNRNTSDPEVKRIVEQYAQNKLIMHDVRNSDRHAELIGQGKTAEEAIEIMTTEHYHEIERVASILFGMTIHQMAKEWF